MKLFGLLVKIINKQNYFFIIENFEFSKLFFLVYNLNLINTKFLYQFDIFLFGKAISLIIYLKYKFFKNKI